MIAKTYILKNLKCLNMNYLRAKTQKEALFFAKLALLELCGWIEESMDDIVVRCSRRIIKKSQNLKTVEHEIVKRNHGFDYERHFRTMLMKVIGLVNVERLEKVVDPTKKSQLESSLLTLKTSRNAEAHTHLKGITRTINAPSVTIAHFHKVYAGLIEIDKRIRQMSI